MEDDQSFTEAQRDAMAGRAVDHDRTLAAMHRLQEALGKAGPRREATWRDDVRDAVAALAASTDEEFRNAERPDSLLADIKRTQPRLRTRVRGLRAQYQNIRDTIATVRTELDENPADAIDIEDLRGRINRILVTMHHQRARESDLIYDAYYDAFALDLIEQSDEQRHDPT